VEFLLAVLIVLVVAAFVALPLRRPARRDDAGDAFDERLADLEARKIAKYREIRDAEADRAAGKLSEPDFRRLDAELRTDAIEILKRIDRLRERAGGADGADERGQQPDPG
jgi:hypothetical protein